MKLIKQNIAEMDTLRLVGKMSAEMADYFNMSMPFMQYQMLV